MEIVNLSSLPESERLVRFVDRNGDWHIGFYEDGYFDVNKSRYAWDHDLGQTWFDAEGFETINEGWYKLNQRDLETPEFFGGIIVDWEYLDSTQAEDWLKL